MPEINIAVVAVEGTSYHFDKPYRYGLSEGKVPVPGARVLVPFGKGNKNRRGIVMSVCAGDCEGLKPVSAVFDDEPLLDDEMIALAEWIKGRTFCTLYESLRLMLPAGAGLKTERQFSLNPRADQKTLSALEGEEKSAAQALEGGKSLGKAALLKAAGLDESTAAVESLIRKRIILGKDSIKAAGTEATESMLRPAVTEDEAKELLAGKKALTPKQKQALAALMELGSATFKEAVYYSGATQNILTALVKKGVVEQYEKRVFRMPFKKGRTPEPSPTLSSGQQKAYESLLEKYKKGEGCAELLFGVTGSGKTLVFLKLIEDIVADGRSAIVLVPEISLTPQTVSRFYSRFGDLVAVLHSGLSVGERLDEWDRIRSGAAKIVVGTRSAVFAPVRSLGLIIIDEEQEHTYKSEASPRFHARDVARYRCAKNHTLLLLASATPSVETFFAARSGRYGLLKLDERYGNAELPEVSVVDMKKELAEGNTSPLSGFLLNEIRRNIRDRQQTILLINRRGYNTFISCADCGHVLTCPNCSIPLTYHSANGRLMCHYCGYSTENRGECPECRSGRLRFSGTGTQKVEQEIEDLLPGARILRMDTDTTMSKDAHEKLLERFAEEKPDLLIGTQMVAKGLDFPNVTLVGVLSADQMLYMNDFRASERAFSLLTQVVGRSGRGGLSGRAVIQTQTPENPVLTLAAQQDYERFYDGEIRLRKLLVYPPYCDLCEIWFSSREEADASGAAEIFLSILNAARAGEGAGLPLKILGPMPANVLRVSGRYRYKIILKCRNSRKFRAFISYSLMEYYKNKISRRAPAFADINPLSNL